MRGDFTFSERCEPRAPESVGGEKPVHIAAGDPAIGANGAFGAAILEAQERPRQRLTLALAHVHLIALEGRTISGAAYTAQRLSAR